MLNKVMLIGNLGKDPVVKPVGDTKVCNFSLATSESYKDKQGNKIDKTEWHNIVIWGNLADVCGKYLKKGSKVYLEGKIATRSYEQDGVTKYTTEVICDSMKMLDGKNDSNSTTQSQTQTQQETTNYPPAELPNTADADDLPF
jgi:single-strand DNA-binding protein